MSAPRRIQRRRVKGWRLPPGAKIVDRSSRWGNPFAVRGREIHAPEWVVVPIRPLPRYVSNVEVAIIAVVFKLAELLDERPHVRPCKGCGRTNLRIDPTGSLCDDCCDGAA